MFESLYVVQNGKRRPSPTVQCCVLQTQSKVLESKQLKLLINQAKSAINALWEAGAVTLPRLPGKILYQNSHGQPRQSETFLDNWYKEVKQLNKDVILNSKVH